METSERLCEEKHNAISGILERHEGQLTEHDKRIGTLERSDASNTTQLRHLADAIGNQTRAIWGLVLTIIGALGGFFIWYIQNH